MLRVTHIDSEGHLADVLTKPMSQQRLLFLRSKLGLMLV